MSDFLKDLSNDYIDLLERGYDHNVIIKVGDASNYKSFYAHSSILKARSPYFLRELSKQWAQKEGNAFVFIKPNITPEVFDILLKYIYGGTVSFDNKHGSEILDILVTADGLELHKLIDFGQDHLIKKKGGWVKENLASILNVIARHESLGNLKTHCEHALAVDPIIMLRSDRLASLDESELSALLKRDDLAMDEVEIWQHMIRWARARTNLEDKDLETWTTDDFSVLERSVRQFIPLIRFFSIPPADFADHVKPFKKFLPKNLRKDLMDYYLRSGSRPPPEALPPRSPAIPSVIIKEQHAAILASWITGNNGTADVADKIPYKFKLLFRGSLHGFSATTFHEKCDSHPGTVVVVKVRGSGRIIGGYNPITWNNYVGSDFSSYYNSNKTYQYANDTFIFLFDDDDDPPSARVSRVYTGNQAIGCGPSWGPYFYDDLMISSNCNTNKRSWYQHKFYRQNLWDVAVSGRPPTSIQHDFEVENYEVLQVVSTAETDTDGVPMVFRSLSGPRRLWTPR